MSATSRRRPLPPIKTCEYGCRYANDGWHAENCPGPSPCVFKDEPEYQREQHADDRERTYEALDRPLSYPEKGVTE